MKTTNPETKKRIIIGGSVYNQLCRRWTYDPKTDTWTPKSTTVQQESSESNDSVETSENITFNYTVFNKDFNVKRIIHLADLHWKTKMYDPIINNHYQQQFTKCYEELQTCITPETVMVIVGDIFHNNLNLETDTIVQAKKWIFKFADLCPVILTTGNHDIAVKHCDRKDCVTSIFSNLEHQGHGIYVISETGHYQFGNICFDFQNLFASNYCIFEHTDTSNGLTNIALYHGTVIGSKVGVVDFDNELKPRISNDGIDPDTFKNYCCVMLGHIHTVQFVRPNIAYAGSLVQQHFGEQQIHGFIQWDLDTSLTPETIIPTFVPVMTNTRFITFEIDHRIVKPALATADDNVDEFNDLANTLTSGISKHYDYNLFVRFISNISADTTVEYVDSVQKLLSECVNVLNVTRYNHREMIERTVEVKEDYDLIELIKDYDNESTNDIESLLDIHTEIAKNIHEETNVVSWILLDIEFQNCFVYGKNIVNRLHFTNDIISIIAPNASGKTSLLKIIKIAMFNDIIRRGIGNVINYNETSAYIKARFIANNEEYTVIRNMTRHTRSGKVSCSCCSELTKIVDSKVVTLDIADLDRLTGSSDNFDQNCVLSLLSHANWAKMKPTAMLEYFKFITNTDNFEMYSSCANEMVRTMQSKLNELEGKIDLTSEMINDIQDTDLTDETYDMTITMLDHLKLDYKNIVITNVPKPVIELETLESINITVDKQLLQNLELKLTQALQSEFYDKSLTCVIQPIETIHENISKYSIDMNIINQLIVLKTKINSSELVLTDYKNQLKTFVNRFPTIDFKTLKPISTQNITELELVQLRSEFNEIISKSPVKCGGKKLCVRYNNDFNNDIESLLTIQKQLSHVIDNRKEIEAECNVYTSELKLFPKSVTNVNLQNLPNTKSLSRCNILEKYINTSITDYEEIDLDIHDNTLTDIFVSLRNDLKKLKQQVQSMKSIAKPKVVPLIEDTLQEFKNNNYTNGIACLESILDGSQNTYKTYLKYKHNRELQNNIEHKQKQMNYVIVVYVLLRYKALHSVYDPLASKFAQAKVKEQELQDLYAKKSSELAQNLGNHKRFLDSCELSFTNKHYCELKQHVKDAEKNIRELENNYNTLLTEFNTNVRQVQEYTKYCNYILDIESIRNQWTLYTQDQKNISDRELIYNEIKNLETCIDNYTKRKSLDSTLDTLQSEFMVLSQRVARFKEYSQLMHKKIPLTILQKKLIVIETNVNHILNYYTKYTVHFEIKNETILEVYFLENNSNVKTSYDSLSGYERIVFQIAFMKNANTGNYQSQVLVIDEAFDIIDIERFQLQLNSLLNLLSELYPVSIFISHRDMPGNVVTRSVKIKTRDGNSELHY